MNLSLDKTHVYCHICDTWKYIGVDTYTEICIEDSAHDRFLCLRCDVLLGYRKDISWLMSSITKEDDYETGTL